MKRILAFVGAFMLVLALASIQTIPVAFAHAEPKDCTPAIDSTVDAVPTQVVCKMGQALDPAQSSLSVFNAAGEQVDLGDSAVDLNDPDRVTISVSLDTAKITDGVYTVKYVTFSTDDNEQAEGDFHFTVKLPAAAETPTAAETPAPTETTAATETPTETAVAETPAASETPTAAAGGTHSDDHSIATTTIDGKEISMQVLSPAKDATVPAGDVVIQAQVEGVTLGENDTYLTFQLDEDTPVQGQGAQTSHIAFLEPGEHDLKVSLTVGGTPGVLQAHVHVTVEPAAVAQTQATATPAPAVPQTLPTTGSQVNYGLYALIAVAGLLALSAGVLVLARTRR